MSVREAFTTLLADVETAFQESLTRSNSAARKGDFETVELELERQKNLISIRDQLQILQELWRDIVGEPPANETQSQPSPPGSYSDIFSTGYKKIQDSVWETWEGLSGRGTLSEIMDQANRRINEVWEQLDLQSLRQQPQPKEEQQVESEIKGATDEAPEGGINSAPPGESILAEEITEKERPVEQADGKGQQTSLPADRPIFANYKKKKYQAVLKPNHHVYYEGTEYQSPSGAAMAITDSSVNGWSFWRYLDEQGNEYPIGHLRQVVRARAVK